MTVLADTAPTPRPHGGPVRPRLFCRGCPEPTVGATLSTGAAPGHGDGLRFDHVDSSPDGWVERLNGNPRGRRVPWTVVAFWLPMRGTL